MEHPEFRCVRIDLDGSPQGAAECLSEELMEPGVEDEIAFRGYMRFVPHVVPSKWSAARNEPCRVSFTSRGTLDNLSIELAHRKQPGPEQVEIAVEVAGMVFRDVLNALDMYPGDAGPLGGECAGRIVAVGAGAGEWQIGDEVVAMAPGAHDGFVIADARLVAVKPAGWTLAEAATSITSYLTACHALNDLARIKAGDSYRAARGCRSIRHGRLRRKARLPFVARRRARIQFPYTRIFQPNPRRNAR
jgi:hypothetical protein